MKPGLAFPLIMTMAVFLAAGDAVALQQKDDFELTGLAVEGRGAAINDAEYAALRNVGVAVPHYSPEQTASMLCRSEKGEKSLLDPKVIHDATLRFEQAKRDVRAGRAPMSALVTAERNRQLALRLPNGSRYQNIAQLKTEMYNGFVLSDVQYSFTRQRGEEVIVVTALAYNRNPVAAPIPPVKVHVADRFGLVLSAPAFEQPGGADAEPVAPGTASRFEIVFNNRPQYASKVVLTLGPAEAARNPRDCGNMAAYRPTYEPLYSEPTAQEREALQAALTGTSARSKFDIKDVSAGVVREKGLKVLEVSGVVRSLAVDSQASPPLAIVLYDAAGQRIGFTFTRLDAESLAPGGEFRFSQRFDTFTRVPGVPDEDLLSRIKRVTVLPG